VAYNPFELLGESDRVIKEWTGKGDLLKGVNEYLMGGLNLAVTLKGDPVAEIIGGSQKQMFSREGGGIDGLL